MSTPSIYNNDKRYLASKFLDVAGNSKENFLYLPTTDIDDLKFISDIPVFIYDTTANVWISYFQGVKTQIGSAGDLHNTLPDLQGGVPNEYYHLSNAQYTKLSQGNFQSNWDASLNSPAIPAASATNKDQFYSRNYFNRWDCKLESRGLDLVDWYELDTLRKRQR